MRASGSQGPEPNGKLVMLWEADLFNWRKMSVQLKLPRTCVGSLLWVEARVVESGSSVAYQTYAHAKVWGLFRGLFELLAYV